MSHDDEWEGDSALGSEHSDDWQSLTSSVLNYTYENGRRYHAFREGQYFMPNDDQEQEAMDLMHHVSSMVLKGNIFRAPVENPCEVLELGTGTGIWAIEVADMFPSANVIATDLSPIQPSWVPPNLQFEVDDCESEWNFDKKFDYIHMRNLSGAIANWPKLIQNCYDHLAPGGLIECSNIEAWGQSHDGTLPVASHEWQSNLKAAAAAIGRELNIGPEFFRLIREAGFEDVQDDQHMVPMSKWKSDSASNELAVYFQVLVLSELEAMSLRLYTAVLGWSPERLQLLLAEVRKEIKDPKNKMFATMYV